ncbi:S41 family peptidase [uncultured Flavobacterium sp.]|uniref:S41 family peptidase n=1 Tax=uncultured Flavobacterium sp. TaxID=165435 RepID=UPI0025DAA970|nr:S41 family peptidase [uncultured Flavobacterium sp.]
MRRILIIATVLFFQCSFSSTLTENQKLVSVCKVWGYLKYYHPKVANGDLNWDQQLFWILSKIEKDQNKEEFSQVLEEWVDSLGKVEKTVFKNTPKEIKYFDKNFNLSWIENQKVFSKNFSKKLRFIENNRFQGSQYYVGAHQGENIFVRNENFSKLDYTNRNSRLLVLFMYWNMIEYFYPYKYLMDQSWDATLGQMLPVFINAVTEKDFYIAMQKLTVRLNDSHGVFYLYPKKSLNFFPASCKIVEEKIVVTEILADSLAKADDIKIGDVITKVNGKTVKEIINDNRDLIYGSNSAAYLNHVLKPTLSGISDSVEIEFLKSGMPISKKIRWYNYHDSHRNEFRKGIKKEKYKILEDRIGYVDMGALKVGNVSDMVEELKLTKAIIFDLRNYPNGTFREISNFLNAQEKVFAIYTVPDLNYPGRFKWIQGTACGSENKNNYRGRVILLMNEDSMSQSEWTAMCFQTAGNTTIIGSQTAGADGNVTEFDLVKAFYTRFSGIGVYYPDGRETQRIGIVPDIEVKPTIQGIQQGRDEVLERALLFIKNGK